MTEVVVSGAAAALLYRATLALILREHRDGLTPSPLLHQLRRELYRAATSPERHEDAHACTSQPCSNHQSACDWCDVAEAAAILRLSRRQVQRMARAPGGLDSIQVGRVWLLRRAPLLALAERRDRDRRTDGVSVELEAL
jgi:excisionase family DNA binding protein